MPLSEVADILMGYPFESEQYNNNGLGIRLARGMNIGSGNFNWDENSRWWNNLSDDLHSYYLQEGDIVIGMDGSRVGKNYAQVCKEDLPLLLVQRVACIRAKPGISQDFLWACIASKNFEAYIDLIKTGTTIPHISGKQIGEYPIPLVSEDEQQFIGRVSAALIRKIRLNTQINANLSELCKSEFDAVFKSAENIAQLSDIAEVCYGKDHKKLIDGPFPVYGSGGIMRYAERPLYEGKESVLIPRKGSLNNIMFISEPFWSVDTMFYTKMKNIHAAKYLYYFLRKQDLASMNSGSAVPSMTTDILNAMEIPIPSSEDLADFDCRIQPYFDQLRQNIKENDRLCNLRDYLLPKLISGEIDVSNLPLPD